MSFVDKTNYVWLFRRQVLSGHWDKNRPYNMYTIRPEYLEGRKEELQHIYTITKKGMVIGMIGAILVKIAFRRQFYMSPLITAGIGFSFGAAISSHFSYEALEKYLSLEIAREIYRIESSLPAAQRDKVKF